MREMAAAAAVRENPTMAHLGAAAAAATGAGTVGNYEGADGAQRDQEPDAARRLLRGQGVAAQTEDTGGLPRDAPSGPGAPPWPWPGGGGEGRPRSSSSSHILPAMKAFLQFLMLNTCYQSGKKEMPYVTSGWV